MRISRCAWAIVVATAAAVGGGCFFTEREEPGLVQDDGDLVPDHVDPGDNDPEEPAPPQSMLCTPGELSACYEGPPGTAGVGACREGSRYCRPDGNDYGPCEGAVLPEAENCSDRVDNDCDGLVDDTEYCFVNRGLVTRHFIDEAAGGTAPSSLIDAAPEPVDLQIDYDRMEFVEDGPHHRGLRWMAEHSNARAWAGVDGTKLSSRLDGAMKMTIEVVAHVDSSDPSLARKTIMALGGKRVAYRNYYQELEFYEDAAYPWVMREEIGALASGRAVLHLVIDYDAVPSSQWIQVYVNGLLQGAAPSPHYQSGISVPPGASYDLGWYASTSYSFVGAVYYAALYDVAFTGAEVSQNAEQLLIDDDRH